MDVTNYDAATEIDVTKGKIVRTLNLSTIDAALNSSLHREIHRMERAQQMWVKSLQPTIGLAEQFRMLTEPASLAAQMANEFQNIEKQRLESIRMMLDPIADIRQSFMVDSGFTKLLKEIERPTFLTDEIAKVAKETSQFGGIAKAMQESMCSSLAHAQEMIAATSITNAFGQTMKAFEEAKRGWTVPTELIDSIGALKAMQEQVGRLTLPVLDFASAATLVKLLGPEGLEAQLAALGIGPDGILKEDEEVQTEAGIGLSRKSLELMTLLSLILAILVPIYQELSFREGQRQTDDKLEALSIMFKAGQAKQFESLSFLVEKALEQEAKRTEQRFVVLDRVAIVRRKPEHGATVEGKLLPRESVKPISEHGQWIQIEYYHWLLQGYQTGWALKKYFKRIPVPPTTSSKVASREKTDGFKTLLEAMPNVGSDDDFVRRQDMGREGPEWVS